MFNYTRCRKRAMERWVGGLRTKGTGTPDNVVIIAVVLIVVGVGVGVYLALPKEQVVIDTTTFVSEERHYPAELKAGQVIHVDIEVIEGGPVVVSVWNDSTAEELMESDFIYNISRDLTVVSNGTHIFEIVNFGDGIAKVRIRAVITGSRELKPAKFEVTSLTISPAEAKIGEKVTVSAEIRNIGEITGTYRVTLKIDGIKTETKEITLSGGSSQAVSFTITENTTGTYAIGVNGLRRNLTIKKNTTTLSISPSFFMLERSSSTTLTATLTFDRIPLSNKTINWSVSRGAVSPTSGMTDSLGQISVNYIAPDYETTDTITAQFAGDSQYLASSENSSCQIATPIFLDDFLGTSVDPNKWTEDMIKIGRGGTSTYNVENSVLSQTLDANEGTGETEADRGTVRTSFNQVNEFSIRAPLSVKFRHSYAVLNQPRSGKCLLWFDQDDANYYHWEWGYHSRGPGMNITKAVDGTGTQVLETWNKYQPPQNTWIIVEIKILPDWTIQFLVDGEVKYQESYPLSRSARVHVTFGASSDANSETEVVRANWDWVKIL